MGLGTECVRSALVTEGLWVATGQVAVAVGLVVTTRLVTGLATPEVVGTISLMMAVSNFARGLFAVPLSLAATRFWPDMEREGRLGDLRRAMAGNLLATTVTMAAVMLAVGLSVGRVWNLTPVLFLLTVVLFALEVFRIQETDYFSAARRQKPAALARGGEAMLKPLLIGLALLLISPTAPVILAGYIAATAITLAAIWMCRCWTNDIGCPGSNSSTACPGSALWSYARPLIPITLFTYIMSISDRLIIDPLAGRAQLGLYAAIYGLGSLPVIMLGSVLETTIRPAYYQAVSAGRVDAPRIFARWVLVTAGMGVLACLAIHLLRGPIVHYLLGPDFRSRPDLLLPIAAGHVLYILSVVFERHCHARGRTHASLLIHGLGAVACLVAQIPLIHGWGITGAAMAVPIYYGVMLVTAVAAAAWWPDRV